MKPPELFKNPDAEENSYYNKKKEKSPRLIRVEAKNSR